MEMAQQTKYEAVLSKRALSLALKRKCLHRQAGKRAGCLYLKNMGKNKGIMKEREREIADACASLLAISCFRWPFCSLPSRNCFDESAHREKNARRVTTVLRIKILFLSIFSPLNHHH